MDPVTGMMLAGTAVQVGSGLLGYFLSRGDQKRADQLQEAALRKYGEVTEETISKVAPEIIPASELAKIQTDPALRDAQMSALDKLTEVYEGGGETLADKAYLNRVNNDLSRQEAVAKNRISDEMATRGIGGGGTELAMMRASGQDGLQRRSQAAMDRAGQAQQRALDAMMGRGDMAGKLRGQDFSEQAQKAAAQDAINRYNAGAKQDVSMWQANARLGAAGTQMQGQNAKADRLRGDAKDKRQVVAGVGQGVAQGMQGGAGYMAQKDEDDEYKWGGY